MFLSGLAIGLIGGFLVGFASGYLVIAYFAAKTQELDFHRGRTLNAHTNEWYRLVPEK